MILIDCTIRGTSPLLMNRFTDAAQIAATEGTRATLTGDKGTPMEQASAALYQTEGGIVAIPQPNLFRCLIDAGKFFKAGKSKVTTQKSSLIPACVAISEIMLPVIHKEPWTVDTRPVRIPATGGRILRHRLCFNDWGLRFTLELEQTEMSEKLLREIVDAAGRKIGLGDFRPDCKGPFGRFVVENWAAIED